MNKRTYQEPLSSTIAIETAPLMASSGETAPTKIKVYDDPVSSDSEDPTYGIQY